MKYRVIYHIGASIGLKTKIKKGWVISDTDILLIFSRQLRCTIS